MHARLAGPICVVLVATLAMPSTRALASDAMPARMAVSVTFSGQPDAPSLPEAVRWVMNTIARSDSLPVNTWRDSSATVVYFADSSWAGNSPVPCGVMDAITSMIWVAPNQPVPSGWPPRRRVRVELPEGEPDQVTLMESGPEWNKYMCLFKHGRFSLGMDDGTLLNADKDSLYVVVWSHGPNVWHPWGLFVFGGTLQSQSLAFTNGPIDASDSRVEPTLQLRIQRVLGTTSGAIAFDVTLAQASAARLDLFDVQGRRVRGWDIDGHAAREQRIPLDGKRPSAGVYWARLVQGREQVTSRVLVLP